MLLQQAAELAADPAKIGPGYRASNSRPPGGWSGSDSPDDREVPVDLGRPAAAPGR